MTIIKMMPKNWTKSIFILLLISITTYASDPSSTAQTDFQLIDLTALLGSLNLTYADLGINPANLTSMAKASDSSTSNQAQTSTKKIQSTTNNPTISQTQNTISSSNNIASNPVTSGQTSSSSASKSNTNDNQKINTNKAASIDIGKNSLPTNLPNKQLTVNPQSTKNNDINSVKNIDTSNPLSGSSSTNSPSTSKFPTTPSPSSTVSTSSQTSSLSGSSTQSSNKNVNSPPIIGPGPTDPNLPPVLDFSKMVVSTNLLTPSQASSTQTATTTSTQISTPISSSTSTSVQSSPQISSNQAVNTLINPPATSSSKNTNLDASSKPSDSQTQASSQSISNPPAQRIELSKSTQNNQPKAPVTSNPTLAVKPTPLNPSSVPAIQPVQLVNTVPSVNTIVADTSSSQSLVGQYQFYNTSQDAIYNVSASYKSFLNYFIISVNDPLLPKLQQYLFKNYGNYLNRGQLTVGLRLYNSDGTLDYQLLYNTNYGTFTSIMTVQPENVKIQLKTLSILNFFIMQIDYPNCQLQNAEQKNCRICKQSYRNFMGRCKPYDPFCIKYSAEECISCSKGKALVSGYCQ